MSALTFWKQVCPLLGLCGPSFSDALTASLQEAETSVSASRFADLNGRIESVGDAQLVLSRVTAFAREKRRRIPGRTCAPLGDNPVPADVQAAIALLVTASTRSRIPLGLDSLELSGVAFRRVTLDKPSFAGACLLAAAFDSAVVNAGRFRGADLTRASFREAALDSSDFVSARLDSARFHSASLVGADLSEVSAVQTLFQFSRMACVLLGNAELSRANFNLAEMPWAYFGGAELGDARNLTQARNVRHATFDGALSLPRAVAQVLADSGALLAAVRDLTWAEQRVAQFAPDATCAIRRPQHPPQ
ncbi:MAG: pentapeptide repeat-containing protein [Gemmatimonadaceae bacterium]